MLDSKKELEDAVKDISWNIAIKYLERMYNRGWLSKIENHWKERKWY